MAKYKYYIEATDIGPDWQDAGPWRSFDFVSDGDTMEELIENAGVFAIDQDGGEFGDNSAEDHFNDDEKLKEFIRKLVALKYGVII